MNNKIALNINLSTIKSKKQNKGTSRKETDSDTENIMMIARWKVVGGMGEKVKGLRRTILLIQNSNGDVKYYIGNLVKYSNKYVCCQMGVRFTGMMS